MTNATDTFATTTTNYIRLIGGHACTITISTVARLTNPARNAIAGAALTVSTTTTNLLTIKILYSNLSGYILSNGVLFIKIAMKSSFSKYQK